MKKQRKHYTPEETFELGNPGEGEHYSWTELKEYSGFDSENRQVGEHVENGLALDTCMQPAGVRRVEEGRLTVPRHTCPSRRARGRYVFLAFFAGKKRRRYCAPDPSRGR
jgi:hypothetical protein